MDKIIFYTGRFRHLSLPEAAVQINDTQPMLLRDYVDAHCLVILDPMSFPYELKQKGQQDGYFLDYFGGQLLVSLPPMVEEQAALTSLLGSVLLQRIQLGDRVYCTEAQKNILCDKLHMSLYALHVDASPVKCLLESVPQERARHIELMSTRTKRCDHISHSLEDLIDHFARPAALFLLDDTCESALKECCQRLWRTSSWHHLNSSEKQLGQCISPENAIVALNGLSMLLVEASRAELADGIHQQNKDGCVILVEFFGGERVKCLSTELEAMLYSPAVISQKLGVALSLIHFESFYLVDQDLLDCVVLVLKKNEGTSHE